MPGFLTSRISVSVHGPKLAVQRVCAKRFDSSRDTNARMDRFRTKCHKARARLTGSDTIPRARSAATILYGVGSSCTNTSRLTEQAESRTKDEHRKHRHIDTVSKS